jgi:hypothetical protein
VGGKESGCQGGGEVLRSGGWSLEREKSRQAGLRRSWPAKNEEKLRIMAPVAPGMVEAWRRVQVASGVELHLRDGLKKLRAADLKNLLAGLEKALRQAD